MSSPRDKKRSGASSDGDEGLLTSEDLFGDIVDEPPRPPARPPAAAPRRAGPVKVQIGEPGTLRAPRKGPLAGAGDEPEVLPDDVAALLDAFSEPGEAATREGADPGLPTRAAPEPPSPGPSAPAGRTVLEARSEEDVLLDALEPMSGPADGPPPPTPDLPARKIAPRETPPGQTRLPASPPPAAPSRASPPAPGAARATALPAPSAPPDEAEVDIDVGLDDLEIAAPQAPASPPPAAAAPARSVPRTPEPSPLEALEALRPAARTATKFQAAAPRKAAIPPEGGLDLGAVAEAAFAAAAPAAPPAPRTKQVHARREDTEPGGGVATPSSEYGPYRLLERIAVGGMAEVFRAKRAGVEGFEKVVAVKRILGHLSDNKEFVDMFIDEAKMVAGLTHPNIVHIFDLGKIEKSYYIAMEYVHGRDLRTILRRARERGIRLPLDLSAHVASQMAAALEYAHRKKDDRGRPMMIVHRDVSPQNILISFEGEVKLADFGIAKAATKATITDRGALRGKLLYMSPEQAWGRAMDRRSDIFSLGICLYEMLTEQKPFLGASEKSILETVRECRIGPPSAKNPRIPEKLERVVLKALERDPEVRYQDAGEMHRELERVLLERQPPTPRDLAKMMEVLFDEAERGAVAEVWTGRDTPLALEEDMDSGPGDQKTAPSIRPAEDDMDIQKLLKRFGIK